jgi:hypothetical protein
MAIKERQDIVFMKSDSQSLCGVTVENIWDSAAFELIANSLFLYRKTFESLNEIALNSIRLFLFLTQMYFSWRDVYNVSSLNLL